MMFPSGICDHDCHGLFCNWRALPKLTYEVFGSKVISTGVSKDAQF